jgi:hypothetical protein
MYGLEASRRFRNKKKEYLKVEFINLKLTACLFLAWQLPVGQDLIHEVSRSHTQNNAPQSVGILWTSDQLVAETPTWQHTTLLTDKHPCPRWDSKPQSQEANCRSPTPQTTRPQQLAVTNSRIKHIRDL